VHRGRQDAAVLNAVAIVLLDHLLGRAVRLESMRRAPEPGRTTDVRVQVDLHEAVRGRTHVVGVHKPSC